MKNKKFFLYILFFLFSHFSVSTQELSNSVYTFLKNSKFSPVKQNLVNSGNNAFSYNIYQTFQTKEQNNQTLLLIFNQEDVIDNQDIIFNILNNIKNADYNFNITVLFSYGDNQKIEKQGMIFGTETYLSSLNSYDDITALLFNFSQKNIITSFSNGITAPAWLIQNEFNIFLKNGLTENLPFYYLSQMYRLNFFNDRNLNTLYKNDIPAVKISFNSKTTDSLTLCNIINDSIEAYSNNNRNNWDKHFLMLRHFKSYVNLSEAATVNIILTIIFIWMLFILILIFININKKHRAWQKVRKIWYIVPVTFLLILLSFYEGKFFFKFFDSKLSDIQKIYGYLGIQIFTAFFNASLIYLATLLLNFDFEAKSLDYLIVISCFINQSVFILVDISLFPIFMTICLLSIIVLLTKKNYLHICIFVLMILPFIPYLHDIIRFSDYSLLQKYILSNPMVTLSFTFVLYPIFIVYFRVVTYYRNIKFQKRYSFLGTGIGTLIILLTITLIALIRTNQITKSLEKDKSVLIHTSREDLIDFDFYDRNVFSETIRTINIKLHKKPVQCNVTLRSENHSPVLYTDYDFESISQNSIFFKIPYYPPEKMSFSYGTEGEPCEIIITLLYENDEENNFTLVSKTVSLGE